MSKHRACAACSWQHQLCLEDCLQPGHSSTPCHLSMQGTKAAPGVLPQALAMLFTVRAVKAAAQIPCTLSDLGHVRCSNVSTQCTPDVTISRYQRSTVLLQGLQGSSQDLHIAVSNCEVGGEQFPLTLA